MRGLGVRFWLTRLLDEQQTKHIDALVNDIGKKNFWGRGVVKKRTSWSDYYQRSQPVQRPLDRILNLDISSQLRSKLIELDQMKGRERRDTSSVIWWFKFANALPLEEAPSPDNYRINNQYPEFTISFEHEPFRLLTGLGTNQYALQTYLDQHVREFEAIASQLNRFPVAEGLITSPWPFDGLLAGHLAIRLLEIIEGYMVISTQVISTASELDILMHQVHQHTYPGKIYRFVNHFETASGPREYVTHAIDVHFLRQWIKHPSFNLF